MNTCRVKARFRNFIILLYRGVSLTTVMNNLTSRLKSKESSTNMWKTKADNFTTNYMATVDFCLMEFGATKIVKWKFHINDYTESR